MKLKLMWILTGGLFVTLVICGCVPTVTGRSTGGMPWIKDRVEGRYERTVNQVYDAVKEVVTYNGTLVNETILHTSSNEVKTVEGKINQRRVWVSVEPVDPKVTAVKVQTRTPGGGTDLDLAHEVEKQIALKLVTSR